MSDTRLVEIQNKTRGSLVYSIPALRVRRELLPNMKLRVPYDEIQESICDYGVRKMFELGYLICTARNDSDDLGLTEPESALSDTTDSIEDIFKSGDKSKIYLLFKNANKGEQDDIINYLVSSHTYDNTIVSWCKKFFDYDLLAALSLTNVEEN